MKAIRFFSFLAIFLIFGTKGFSQDIAIRFQIMDNLQLQTLYLSDLDFLQQGLQGTSEQIFKIIVDAPGDLDYTLNKYYENCQIIVLMRKDDQLLASFESNRFKIPQRAYPYEITNDILMNGQYDFEGAGPESQVEIVNSEIYMDKIENLRNDILSSGKLPIGNYSIEIQISYHYETAVNPNNVSLTFPFTFITATNPSFIQLMSPGSSAGGGLPQSVYSEFPVFQWTGNGEEFQVIVFEKRSQSQTIDDVINSRENWKSEPSPVQSIIYPQSGEALPLEFGKTYYWMVKMFIQTSSGVEEINSEVWQFNLVDPANQSDQQAMMSTNDILDFLRDLIGSRADEISKSLEDYQVSTIKINGTEITIQELYNLLNSYRGHKVEVQDIILPGTLN